LTQSSQLADVNKTKHKYKLTAMQNLTIMPKYYSTYVQTEHLNMMK